MSAARTTGETDLNVHMLSNGTGAVAADGDDAAVAIGGSKAGVACSDGGGAAPTVGPRAASCEPDGAGMASDANGADGDDAPAGASSTAARVAAAVERMAVDAIVGGAAAERGDWSGAAVTGVHAAPLGRDRGSGEGATTWLG